MDKADKKRLCRGCRDDYYNHGNNSTNGECWLLSKARPVFRTLVGIWQNPPYTWHPQKTLHCHNPDGSVWIDRSDVRIKT